MRLKAGSSRVQGAAAKMPQTELRQQTLVPRSPGLKSKVKAQVGSVSGEGASLAHSPYSPMEQWEAASHEPCHPQLRSEVTDGDCPPERGAWR